MQWILRAVALLLVAATSVADEDFTCNICGEGQYVNDPLGVVTLVTVGDVVCGDLDLAGLNGSIAEVDCALLQQITSEPCDCTATDTSVSSTSPTSAPTEGATEIWSPTGECWDNLTALYLTDFDLSSDFVLEHPRTYILCPDTTYEMGFVNSVGGFDDGFEPLQPRPHIHYKCGDDGSSSNNCVLTGGDYGMISFSSPDIAHNNVTLQGITFDNLGGAAALFARAGNFSFVDCIFKNHKGYGVVIGLFLNRDARRNLQESSGVELANFVSSVRDGTHRDTLEEVPGRVLEDTGIELLDKADIDFRRCIFEDNEPGTASTDYPGMIVSEYDDVLFSFSDCIFRNNNYADTLSKPSTYAILSRGDLSIQDCCFIDNHFLRESPVIQVGNTTEVILENNFVSESDDGLVCSFVAVYGTEAERESLEYQHCFSGDATICESNLVGDTPSPTTAPTSSPTDSAGVRNSAVTALGAGMGLLVILSWI
eukprot:Nitzschia sp. Nitz4//scaffold2_size372955//289102//290753//NITZ4_000456-RA/size372955-snap-gene-0.45-mRNA-1//1//CDS//3329546877//6328//frame0